MGAQGRLPVIYKFTKKKIEKDPKYYKFEQNTERIENHSLFTPDTNKE